MKIRMKIVYEVDEWDFNEVVLEFYDGILYFVCLVVEGSNGDSYLVMVDGGELDEYDVSKLKRWWEIGWEGYSLEFGIVLLEMIWVGVVLVG